MEGENCRKRTPALCREKLRQCLTEGICRFSELFELLVPDKQKSMIKTPEQVVQTSAMPESAQGHGEDKIAHVQKIGAARAAKGNEQIVPKPGGKGYVPAMPEVGDG